MYVLRVRASFLSFSHSCFRGYMHGWMNEAMDRNITLQSEESALRNKEQSEVNYNNLFFFSKL